jgi:hypothetical protein
MAMQIFILPALRPGNAGKIFFSSGFPFSIFNQVSLPLGDLFFPFLDGLISGKGVKTFHKRNGPQPSTLIKLWLSR